MGEKRKSCEADLSLPSDYEIKATWICTLKWTSFTKIIYKNIYKLFWSKLSCNHRADVNALVGSRRTALHHAVALPIIMCLSKGLIVNDQKSNDNFYGLTSIFTLSIYGIWSDTLSNLAISSIDAVKRLNLKRDSIILQERWEISGQRRTRKKRKTSWIWTEFPKM